MYVIALLRYERFAILYCHHGGKSPEQVTLGEFEGGLEDFSGGSPCSLGI